jgi:multiple sugar transport system ATP-binding protein
VVSESGAVRARVDVVEPLGNETHLYVVVGSEQTEQLVLSVPSSLRPREGDVLGFDIPPAAIKRFDPETGERIAA